MSKIKITKRQLRRIIKEAILEEGFKGNAYQSGHAIADEMVKGFEFEDAVRKVFPKYEDPPSDRAAAYYERVIDEEVRDAFRSKLEQVDPDSQEAADLTNLAFTVPGFRW